MKKKILVQTALLASLGLFLASSAIAGPHHGHHRRCWGIDPAPKHIVEEGKIHFSGAYGHGPKAIHKQHKTAPIPYPGR